MSDLLDNIAEQLRHYSHEKVITLVCDFLAELDEDQQKRFLNMITPGPHPLVAESMGLGDVEDLLDEIQSLHDAIANGEYVDFVDYHADYGAHTGFGDDGWIDEMDDLFDAATSFFRAGRFTAAARTYIALFHVFDLSGGDGFYFTHPRPYEALRTEVDTMKENLFIAIGHAHRDPASKAVELSSEFRSYGDNDCALLDAWQGHGGLMSDLEAVLIRYARRPISRGPALLVLSHTDKLLHEFYRRYRDVPDYEFLCRQVGPQRGWPYEELVGRYLEYGNWERALAWAEDGLAKLPADSGYRPFLQEARGQALLQLDRPAEAFDELQALYPERRTPTVYLKLRDAARASDRWETVYPQLTAEMEAHVLEGLQPEGIRGNVLEVGKLLGYAYLLEGDWQKAVAWASNPSVSEGWWSDDLVRPVATDLLRMGLAGYEEPGDEVLTEELCDAADIMREHGDRLEPVAQSLPADALLDAAVRLYERLVKQAIGFKNRHHYAIAGRLCQIIQSIRRLQGREDDFERYYEGLFATYSGYSALKDELRKAVGEVGD